VVTYAAESARSTRLLRDGRFFGTIYNRTMTYADGYVDLVVPLGSRVPGPHPNCLSFAVRTEDLADQIDRLARLVPGYT
jgi:hypothetical protein